MVSCSSYESTSFTYNACIYRYMDPGGKASSYPPDLPIMLFARLRSAVHLKNGVVAEDLALIKSMKGPSRIELGTPWVSERVGWKRGSDLG